jgi:C4-dicarboxylate-specific signal transduction histidine kinase
MLASNGEITPLTQNAPMFSFIDTYLGRGIVGGPLLSHQTMGKRAVNVALRIFAGETPGDIKTPAIGFEEPAFDWRELQHWQINEASLPPGSIIKFREPTVWERYRWRLTATIFALLAQAAIISWLLIERRRRHEAELESRGRLLEVIHLNRTAAAGALSASIAHELNQPLGAIQSYAEAAEQYLKSSPPNLSRALNILANIRRDDRRAAEIITHLRNLLKKRPEVVVQEFDLNNAIRNAIQVLDAEAAKREVALVARLSQKPLCVRADQVQLQQVILNLALNGLEAMQNCDGGPAVLTIQSILAEDKKAEVSIADSGSGIPIDKLSTVFETFFTTKQQGTGLGLSIARTIVENCGGRIWAENRSGGGAVLRFTLPLADKSVA